MHLEWGPNAYSKPDSNLITGPDIKTRQETAQCLEFLVSGLQNKSNGLYREDSLLPLGIFSCKTFAPFPRKKPEKRIRPTPAVECSQPSGEERLTPQFWETEYCLSSCSCGFNSQCVHTHPWLQDITWVGMWDPPKVDQQVLPPRHVFQLCFTLIKLVL